MLSPRRLDFPTDADIERSAFNSAFYQLGLRWHWDEATYERLAVESGDRQRVRRYLEQAQAHLLRAYDADVLAQAVVDAKCRLARSLAHCTRDALPRLEPADTQTGDVGF
ncbi:MAG: hypothetical protein JNJ42_14680 [Burkholderiaceae bacterium]|nr:hypothetical protein [Burkholderiaceae bacterium]